jgi:predicted ferric reductase
MRRPNRILWWLGVGVVSVALVTLLSSGGIPTLSASISQRTAFWYLSRVGGFVAYVLLWLSVTFGLLLKSKIARVWPGMGRAAEFHRNLSAFALVYIAFHALILLGDRYIGFTLGALLIPFATAAYRPFWVGLGQIAAYLTATVVLSSYARRRIGTRMWRALHYATFILFYLALAHALLAGTDARTPWALALYISTGVITYALTVYRILSSGRAATGEICLHKGAD